MASVFCVWHGFYTKYTLVSMGLMKGLHVTFNNGNNSSSSWATDSTHLCNLHLNF